MKFAIFTLGCKTNQYESELMRESFLKEGFSEVDFKDVSDVYVINSCVVTEKAERETRKAINEALRKNPLATVVLTGCYTKLHDEFKDRRVIIYNGHRNALGNFLKDGKEKSDLSPEKIESFLDRTRAFVKIEEGCNNFCTYCIVPYVRGRERSRSKESIKKEIERAVANGFKEFTLLGQNVNSYGKDQGNSHSFAELLKECNDILGVERIRYMTSHPRDMSEEVVKVVSECKNICENFHIPAQSGSNRILKAMNRGYTREKYLSLVDSIKKYCPEAAITTDIIVGFPGETEEDFQDTLSLMREVQFDAAYTFIYSKRSGTPAAGYEDQIPLDVKKERLNRLMEVQNENSLAKNKLLIGKKLEVLAEGPSQSNSEIWTGRTRTNKLVLWPVLGKEYTIGQSVNIEITSAQTWLLKGKAES